ncbi:hypothetical protein [Streptomyces sp. I6]|uniref:hypothetical protein n=1 Tax=Streptomyces sp. I6 TaxID=2483113 RepID=UPI000F448AA8|nr:hypothetical protein [Streptomyces sp. I6]RNL70136.1 hypothetical protein EBF04_01105 [Streptomyces sp. I6]
MGSIEDATTPQGARVCPVCRRPVTAEVQRHKTMGLYVPRWKPGPCREPSCPRYADGRPGPSGGGVAPFH